MARRHRRAEWLLALLCLAIALVPRAVAGASIVDGLDPTFGQGGTYRLDLTEPSLDVAEAAASTSSGLVVAGTAGDRFALASFYNSGAWFNGGQEQLIVGFPRPSAAHALNAVGGRLVAAGSVGSDFALAWFWDNGQPLADVGDQGRVRTSFGAPAAAYGLADLYSGVTLAVGTAGSGIAMARYGPGGALDPSFGAGGKLTVDITPGPDAALAAVATFNPGEGVRFFVAGRAGPDAFVARYRLDGTPDTTFGAGGRVILDLSPGDDVAHALSVDASGKVVVAGSAGTSAFVARLSPVGTLDPAFGTAGVVRTNLGGTAARITSVFAQVDEAASVVVSGTVTGPAGGDAVAARFSTAGAVDAGFGQGGRAVVDFGGPSDTGAAAATDAGALDKVLRIVGGDGGDMKAATVKLPDGSGTLGARNYDVRTIDFGAPTVEEATAVTTQPDGRTVVAGYGTRGMMLVRLLPTGAPDPAFGVGGVVVPNINATPSALVITGGRILVLANRAANFGGPGLFGFTSTGALDPSFGEAGRAYIDGSGSAVAVLPGGGLVVGGGPHVVRLSSDGAIVATTLLDRGDRSVVAISPEADGSLVVLMVDTRGSGNSILRLRADGSTDASFGAGAVGTAVPSVLLHLADGRFVIGARTELPGGPAGDLLLRAIFPDGSTDVSFGTQGVVRVAVTDMERVVALLQQTDGRIVAVHSTNLSSSSRYAGVSRFLLNGRLDQSFGRGGVSTVADVNANAVALTSDDRIVVAGRTIPYPNDLVVARVLPPAAEGPTAFHPLAPVRLYDTRTDARRKLSVGDSISLQVAGRVGLPTAGVSAVVLNVTVTEPTSVSYLTAWPWGLPRPLASNLNFAPGQTVANQVVVKLGDGGMITIYNDAGQAHVIVDVAGWYGQYGAAYSALTPARLLDTRTGNGAPVGRVGPGSTLALQATGRGGVPATGVTAVVLNITATEPSDVSYLAAWPAGQPRPLASSLNYGPGRTVPNLVTVPVGADGKVSLYNNAGTVHLIADVAGWFGTEGAAVGARYVPLAPSRVLDTRSGNGAPPAKVGAASTVALQVAGRGGVPVTGVSAVLLNVTVTEPGAESFLTVWPAGEARPLASNLNYVGGQTAANLVVVKVGAGGSVTLYNNAGSAHLVADVAGWYG